MKSSKIFKSMLFKWKLMPRYHMEINLNINPVNSNYGSRSKLLPSLISLHKYISLVIQIYYIYSIWKRYRIIAQLPQINERGYVSKNVMQDDEYNSKTICAFLRSKWIKKSLLSPKHFNFTPFHFQFIYQPTFHWCFSYLSFCLVHSKFSNTCHKYINPPTAYFCNNKIV